MQPFFSALQPDKNSAQAIYLQLAEFITNGIRSGQLLAGTRLPGTRQLAEHIQVHRKTVVRAYDDLLAQGWLESRSGSGTFVASHLPEIKPQLLVPASSVQPDPAQVAGFSFQSAPHLERKELKESTRFHLDDGYPDPRLAPLQELSRAYRTQLLMGNSYNRLGYNDTQGSLWLREELVKHLQATRGLNVTTDQILITRGTIMGIHLACSGLLHAGDKVAAGSPGYISANANFAQAGAQLLPIPVDAHGIQVDELEKLCQQQSVRMVYVTPHHHYPTTVSLRADRRLQLLRLSAQYGFIVFEDDYDYDFHYLNKPLLPLASADRAGMVLYCGSFTKTISPGFRVGYLVGPANVIRHLARLRRIIDRQGDIMLENAMAELLQNGIIQRHLRKSLRVYRQRRDVFCSLLQSSLGSYINFQTPEGGMAVWANFDPAVNLKELAHKARFQDLFFSDGSLHQSPLQQQNATRLGFASSNIHELEQCVDILVRLLKR